MCHDAACEHEKAELRAKIAELEAKLKKPPKNSSNSSLPPSQDPHRKYPKKEKSNRPTGGQPGHPGSHHPFSADPDTIEDIYPETCEGCGSHDLLPLDGPHRQAFQEVNLPEIKPVVTEFRLHESLCQHCGKVSRGRSPAHIQAPVQLGQSLSGLIGYLKQVQHMSHQRIVFFFRDVMGLTVSEGFVQNRLKALGESLQETYDAIGKALPQQTLIGSDETPQRVKGENKTLWTFQNGTLCYFVGNTSRKFDVVKAIFGLIFNGTWVSDRGGSQIKIEADHQFCLVHLIRGLRYIVEAEGSDWALALQMLFKEAIHFRKEQAEAFDPVNNQDVFRQCQSFRDRLAELFQKPPPTPLAKTLFCSLVGRQKELFLFLQNPDVPHHNNASEQALRQPVVHRKVLGGFRTDEGAKIQDILLSIIETAKRQGFNILDVLCKRQALMFSS